MHNVRHIIKNMRNGCAGADYAQLYTSTYTAIQQKFRKIVDILLKMVYL